MSRKIDPKDLMAVERTTTSLIGTSISLIILGFVVEKFELFLNIMVVELKDKSTTKIPQLNYAYFYNYLGIFIVVAGILLAIYTYIYYVRWVKNLEAGTIDTDKKVYLFLSIFISLVGLLLLGAMIIL